MGTARSKDKAVTTSCRRFLPVLQTASLVLSSESFFPCQQQLPSRLLHAATSNKRPCRGLALRWGVTQSREDLLGLIDGFQPFHNSFDKKKEVLSRMRERYRADCEMTRSSLAVEDNNEPNVPHTITYEWIVVDNGRYPLAIRSTEPVLSTTSVAKIRAAADSHWKNSSDSQKSRFTYQQPGNYEVHVADLSREAVEAVNDCLEGKIYPLVRQALWKDVSSRLCVYDALVIRYNATAAPTKAAGQPFHRDFGVVSINIMLNSADDFVGGGTFFENQMRLSTGDSPPVAPLGPKGLGHCLAHYSSERHAGSNTLVGVRDILVIFIAAEQADVPHVLIQNALLKQCRSFCKDKYKSAAEVLVCRILHLRLAAEAVPDDGEAWQYLGSALMEYSDLIGSNLLLLVASKHCLEHAASETPCDSRVYNNLGLVLRRLSLQDPSQRLSVEANFERAWAILQAAEHAGVDVAQEFDTLALNYGLYVSNQDFFLEACRILQRVAQKKIEGSENRVVDDAYRLYNFCRRQLEQ
jgi:hypothetical protein